MSFKKTSLPLIATMAEAVNVTDGAALEASLNDSLKNATGRIPSTPEGMAVAYGSLVIMAMLPIFFGAYRSVKYHREQKVGAGRHIVY